MEKDDIICPSIVFRIRDGLYSINSKHVSTIMQIPEYQEMPETEKEIKGIFTYRGEAVILLDVRVLFEMPTLSEEYESFSEMLDQRIIDHKNWVAELKRSVSAEEDFTLSTDPHLCAFGKWYYNFHSENNSINFHLKKIEVPHRELHEAALAVQDCNKDHAHCKRKECVKNVLERAEQKDAPLVIKLLEEAKDVFKSAYHEMLLVLDDGKSKVALIVDEVLCVETLQEVSDEFGFTENNNTHYVVGVMKTSKVDGLILDLDDSKFMNMVSYEKRN